MDGNASKHDVITEKGQGAKMGLGVPWHFHHLKFVSYDVYSLNPLDKIVVDSIHIDLVHFDKYGNVIPGQFDTAIIQIKDHDPNGNSGLKGMFLMFSSKSPLIQTPTKH